LKTKAGKSGVEVIRGCWEKGKESVGAGIEIEAVIRACEWVASGEV